MSKSVSGMLSAGVMTTHEVRELLGVMMPLGHSEHPLASASITLTGRDLGEGWEASAMRWRPGDLAV